MTDDSDTAEQLIRRAFDAEDMEGAATLVVEHYGAELFGYLAAQFRDVDEAADAFGRWSETFWESLSRFEWRCSARTWAYKLARRAAAKHRERERRHEHRGFPTQLSRLSVAVARVRTDTAAYKRTDVKDQFRQLREELPEEDQNVLILRVDRGLGWLDIAEIMWAEKQEPTAEQLKTEAARLRKRFQLAKERLRQMVEDAGLLEPS